MIAELGEAIQIIKKCGEGDIINDVKLRKEYITELADVLMYFSNSCICFDITPEELSEAFIKKHNKNMNRDFLQRTTKIISATNILYQPLYTDKPPHLIFINNIGNTRII